MTVTAQERPAQRAATARPQPHFHTHSHTHRHRYPHPSTHPHPARHEPEPGLVQGEAFLFKFKYLNDQGNEDGFLAERGAVRDGLLTLDDGFDVPLADVSRAVVRQNRLVLTVLTGGGRTETLALALKSGPGGGREAAEGLKRRIDRVVSSRRAAWRLGVLREEGRESVFRASTCGHCGSTVDLTGFARTPQVYCPCCDAVGMTRDADADADTCDVASAPDDGADYQRCDGCAYYSRTGAHLAPGAVVTPGRSLLCQPCTRGRTWAAFWGNGLSRFGVRLPLSRLARAYSGAGPARTSALDGLDVANAHARQGRPEAAESLYQEILARAPHAAGVHFNRALVRSTVGDWAGCLDAVKASWADCSNYTPALTLAMKSLKALGRDAEADTLKARWAAAR